MKLPIRNHTATALTLFVEPYCDEYEIPPECEAIVTLEDGEPHSLDFHPDNFVSLWNGESPVIVEIVSKEQNTVVDALRFVRGWLFQSGAQGQAAGEEMAGGIELEEQTAGYVEAHFAAYRAFRQGFRAKASEADPQDAPPPDWTGSAALAGAYRAGGEAALFNHRVRLQPRLIELGEPPFDTDLARLKFAEADAVAGE